MTAVHPDAPAAAVELRNAKAITGLAILGFFLKDEVDRSHEGSELLETNI